jgi:Cu-processing system permease protein
VLGNILTIAHLTLVEARRRRILLAAVVCAFAFLTVFGAGMFLASRDMAADTNVSFLQRQLTLTGLTIVGFLAANFLSVVFAIVLPVDTLSGEIDSGVMQTIASKPITRAEIVLGKWIGHLFIACAYLLVISVGILVVVRSVAGYVPVSVERALPLMTLEITLLLTVSVAGGARLSTVTNAVAVLGFYGLAFVGGYVEQIGSFAGIPSARTIGVIVSLISPGDALWRLAVHFMQPALVRGAGAPLFLAASVPTTLMVWWAAGFTVAAMIYGVRAFNRRAL